MCKTTAGGSCPWQQISPEVVVRGFRNCCICDEIVGRETEEEAGNVGSEHETRWEL
jgi:hypothetical protein